MRSSKHYFVFAVLACVHSLNLRETVVLAFSLSRPSIGKGASEPILECKEAVKNQKSTAVTEQNFVKNDSNILTVPRRFILATVPSAALWLVASGGSRPAFAADSVTSAPVQKPYAPVDNLLPATRVRLYLDDLLGLAKQIQLLGDQNAQTEIQRLADLFQDNKRERFFTSKNETEESQRYLREDTWDEWSRNRRNDKNDRSFFQQGEPTAFDAFQSVDESLQRWGTRQQFLRLRRQQQRLEQSNGMRAAFNSYTNNLVFGDKYQLNVAKSEKSKMIRNDRLPDVTTVVRSDLDLRDLYRNQVLDYFDDAVAEFNYQIRNKREETSSKSDTLPTSIDANDLVDLLTKAQNSCSEWFKFIDEEDVQEALALVRSEK